MLLGREISIPPRKTLKALRLDRFASTLCLPPGAHRFKVIPARNPVKVRIHPWSAAPEPAHCRPANG